MLHATQQANLSYRSAAKPRTYLARAAMAMKSCAFSHMASMEPLDQSSRAAIHSHVLKLAPVPPNLTFSTLFLCLPSIIPTSSTRSLERTYRSIVEGSTLSTSSHQARCLPQYIRAQQRSRSASTMGVEKMVMKRGNGNDVPKKHDEVSVEYTGNTVSLRVTAPCLTNHAGWLYSDDAPDKKGKQ